VKQAQIFRLRRTHLHPYSSSDAHKVTSLAR